MDDGSSAAERPPRIDLTSQTDTLYWSRIFGLTLDELRDAVHHAGHQVEAVQRYLREKKGAAG